MCGKTLAIHKAFSTKIKIWFSVFHEAWHGALSSCKVHGLFTKKSQIVIENQNNVSINWSECAYSKVGNTSPNHSQALYVSLFIWDNTNTVKVESFILLPPYIFVLSAPASTFVSLYWSRWKQMFLLNHMHWKLKDFKIYPWPFILLLKVMLFFCHVHFSSNLLISSAYDLTRTFVSILINIMKRK